MRRRAKREPAAEATSPGAGGDAVAVALRLLSFRARSRHEIDLALSRRGFDAQAVARAMARLDGWGYLNDARFARERARTLLASGRFGRAAVQRRLAAHGIDAVEAKAALAEAERELGYDAAAAARAVLERRGLFGRALTLKEKAKAGRLLLGRGFTRDVIAALVGELPLDPGGGDD